jgi:hypothetical protein
MYSIPAQNQIGLHTSAQPATLNMHSSYAVLGTFGGSHTYVTIQSGIGFGNLCLGNLRSDMLGPANGKRIQEHI